MVIDNFDQIRSILKFDEEGDWFYLVQIIQRKKDEECNVNINSKIIQLYYINSIKQYDELAEEIKFVCSALKARAYISLNPSSWKKCCLKSIGTIGEYIASNQYNAFKNIVGKMAGNCIVSNNGLKKRWLIDYDSKDVQKMNEIISIINISCRPYDENKIITILPTKNGYHLITNPFNLSDFTKIYSNEKEISIHKNSPTLLYYKDSKS